MKYGPAVIAVVWLGFVSATPSAAEDAPRFSKGLIVGITTANLSGGDFSELIDPESRVSVGGGVFVAHSLFRGVSIQVRALYTGKGAKTISIATDPDGNEIGEITSTWKLDYVNVPVLLRLAVPIGPRVRPFVSAGPDFGFNVASEVKTELNGAGSLPNQDFDAKSPDVGIAGGLGLEFGVGSGWVFLDAQYTLGLSGAFGTASPFQDKNRAWAFSLGYGF